jgi:ABC-type dipeptide/oligopeptide/nickel transport system permease component
VWDRLAMGFAVLGQSLPPFWTGTIAVLIFAVHFGWLPSSGIGGWRHYVLPVMTLSWFICAGIIRLLRSSLLDQLDSEYVKFARIKGVKEHTVLWKHAVRNALIPVVTFVGFMYGIIIAAAITTEVVFAWPGLGQLLYQAVLWRDFPLIQASVLVFTATVVVISVGVDVIYAILDPRVRV